MPKLLRESEYSFCGGGKHLLVPSLLLKLSLARKKKVLMNGLVIPEFIAKTYQQMKNAIVMENFETSSSQLSEEIKHDQLSFKCAKKMQSKIC
jgi:hypothetical protein